MSVVAVLAAAGGASAKATTSTTNEQEPFAFLPFVPCANGGAGELVLASGTLHVLTHVTTDGHGGFHITQHFQSQGASGVGLVTGDRYRFQFSSISHHNATGAFETTLTSKSLVIGPGPDNNRLLHLTMHVTVNAEGEVTTEVSKLSVECR